MAANGLTETRQLPLTGLTNLYQLIFQYLYRTNNEKKNHYIK